MESPATIDDDEHNEGEYCAPYPLGFPLTRWLRKMKLDDEFLDF